MLKEGIMKKGKKKSFSIIREIGLPKTVKFGDKEIELDESMFVSGFFNKKEDIRPRKVRIPKTNLTKQLSISFPTC